MKCMVLFWVCLTFYVILSVQPFMCEGKRRFARHSRKELVDIDEPYIYGYSCERIDVEYCKDFGYNFTRMPNTLGHQRQDKAKLQLDTFEALVDVNCSAELQWFLCAVYLPMCDSRRLKPSDVILPCQGWCVAEQSKCNKVMASFEIDWPDALNCSQFLPYNGYDKLMCMEGPVRRLLQTTSPPVTTPVNDFCRYNSR